jgi:hypothetical protein
MTEYLIKKLPVPLKRATVILIKVKSCNALFCMLLVCIRICLKSVQKNTFLILDTYHPDIAYFHQQGREDPRLLFGAKRSPRAKCFGNTALRCLFGAGNLVYFTKLDSCKILGHNIVQRNGICFVEADMESSVAP